MKPINDFVNIKGNHTKKNNRFIFLDKRIICKRSGSAVEVKDDAVSISADVTGIDKIYFSLRNNQLIISNRFKDFMPERINKDFIGFQMKKGYIPYPFTILDGVMKAPPGLRTRITFDRENKMKCTYEPSNELKIFNRDLKFKAADTRKIMDRLLRRGFRSKGIISSFSGGFDSLLLTLLLQDQCKGMVNFTDGPNPAWMDNFRNKWPSMRWTVRSSSEKFTDENRKSYFESVDEPCCDAAGFAEYLMIKKLKAEMKTKMFTVMNGQGADGLFCNGRNYFQEFVASKLRTKATASIFTGKSDSRFMARMHRYTADTKKRFYELYLTEHSISEEAIREIDAIYDTYRTSINNDSTNFLAAITLMLKYSLHGIEKIKTSSRATGAKYLLPFMSTDVIKYAFSMPSKHKVGYRQGKKVLIRSYPEISRMNFHSSAFIPTNLKRSFIISRMGKTYEEFFTNYWMKTSGAA